MHSVIEFLETLSRDPAARFSSDIELEQAMTEANLQTDVRTALIAGDVPGLEELLGAPTHLCCMVHTPEDEEEETDDDDDDEEDGQEEKEARN
jgi:hypothetical protein